MLEHGNVGGDAGSIPSADPHTEIDVTDRTNKNFLAVSKSIRAVDTAAVQ